MKQSEYIKLETDLKILLDKYKKLEEENKQLKENRDKAIEFIEWQEKNPQYDNVWRTWECESLIKILKGNSNE